MNPDRYDFEMLFPDGEELHVYTTAVEPPEDGLLTWRVEVWLSSDPFGRGCKVGSISAPTARAAARRVLGDLLYAADDPDDFARDAADWIDRASRLRDAAAILAVAADLEKYVREAYDRVENEIAAAASK
jgi:hypothetical protein